MAGQQRPSGILASIQNLADRIVKPETRSQLLNNVSNFANRQPVLATFLGIQIILSFTPLALFLSFSTGVLILSFVCALLFSLFWIGLALLILVPTLFVTVSIGIAAWLWLVTTFLVVRWMYNLLPVNVKGEAELALPNGKRVVLEKAGGGHGDLKGEVRDGV